MENLVNNKISKEKQENVRGGDVVPLICQACGAAVAAGASACGNCGEPINNGGGSGHSIVGFGSFRV